jgi:glyoxylase-like metal-dependent hydrolase (beta-lactamase superfamily II)
MIIGDTLCGGREDIDVPDGEIGIFSTHRITDPMRARDSLKRLAEIGCDLVCFGHGSPVREPRRAFEKFLDRTDLAPPAPRVRGS